MQLKLNPSRTLTPNVSPVTWWKSLRLSCGASKCGVNQILQQISQNAELVAKLTLGQHCCYSQINYMSKFDT